ncbi:cyclin-dependent protein kinase [Ordospora colligata]|uniref:Cyclin-dependent kinase 1 n=1 Tax=Ordospora colligata OC4 TaxID=1354746 RepID=A0A0B2UIX1_9MICR|nr:cyclin-dependent protein kinase [Ordospora colligata OC4]KHN69253.1 cyclin-dependent protein kinase [Ordospora colligata OC4]TBU14531.1 cyclin-dependent protein kinase [Ordospora colligata]TBU14708.1 cyclin-dependent protein kinase [Ordospora colligata]TBU18093.1 cyclin-dependent protein kinase [Ordospora colligata]
MAESFQKLEKIGEGTYGVVYKAIERNTQRIVALKKIRLENENEGIPATTIREILLLKNIKHSTIVELSDVIYNNNKMYLVFEYMELDLRRYLDKLCDDGRLPSEEFIRKMSQQLLTAMEYCHSRNIFHRDLKPQNILVDLKGNIKLADFGLGRVAGIPLRTYTTEVVTLWYRPPELLLGCKYYDASVDVWSAACIMAEVVLMKPFFSGDSEIDQLFKIFKILGTPSNSKWSNVENFPNYKADFPIWSPVDLKTIFETSQDFIDLISQMLEYDPRARMSAKAGLSHRYFKNMSPILE